jgi:hypothetical protein
MDLAVRLAFGAVTSQPHLGLRSDRATTNAYLPIHLLAIPTNVEHG